MLPFVALLAASGIVRGVSLLLSPVVVHTASRSGPQTNNASLGHIYALSRNASTNDFQYIDCDLTTWETSVSSLPPGVGIAGEAAAYASASHTFWSFTLDHAGERSLIGIDVITQSIIYTVNASAWDPPVFMVSAIFVAASGSLVVIGVPNPGALPLLYYVSDPTGGGAGNTSHLGSLPCAGCSDWAWDPADEVLFAEYNEDSSDASSPPGLVAFSVANASAPVLVSNFTLDDDFEFPQWDPVTRSVFGLELQPPGPDGSYTRNLTLLADPAGGVYSATSHGPIGDGLYVSFDGKAFDPETRRAFFMLASGPFAEFDLVAVSVDANPVAVEEAPPLCGFVGYCPFSYVFGDPSRA